MSLRGNKIKLRKLMKKHELTQKDVAAMLTSLTKDNVNDRSVRRWMAHEDLESSRSCPGWVIYVLENELGD